MRRALILLFLGVLASLALLAAADDSPKTVTILFTGDCRGWIKPCGCAGAEMRGGIMRRATFVEQERASNPGLILVDLGHNFQPGTTQEGLKAATLLQSLKLLDYDAMTFGKDDFLFGTGLLMDKGPAPYVSANVSVDSSPAGFSVPYKLIERGPRPVMIIGVTGPNVLYTGEGGSIKISDPAAAVKRAVEDADAMRPRPIVLVLAAADPQTAADLFKLPGVDLLIRSNLQDPEQADFPKFSVEGGRAWAEAADQGRLVGRIKVALDDDGAIRTVTIDYVPLTDGIADHPAHKRLYDDYQEEVKRMFLESAAQSEQYETQSIYAGSEACMKCHGPDFEVWVDTKHAMAMESLSKAGQDFDPECLECHTVGLGVPGGFLTAETTPALANVGCEACHGPRKAHIADPTIADHTLPVASEATCRTCHTNLRDPKFNFSVRWPNISHGKSKVPARQ